MGTINWGQILSDLGVFALIIGGISWLLKAIGQHFIDKRFKAYEKELDLKSHDFQAKLNHDLESFKARLNIEHTQYLKLQEKRLNVLTDLYNRLANLDTNMRALTSPMKFLPENQTAEQQDKELMEASRSAYIKFREFYKNNKIFFSLNDCQLIDKLVEQYTSVLLDGTSRQRLGNSAHEINRESQLKAIETLHTHIPPIMTSLENEFRATLGVK
jgi:hypothetical protein